MSGQTQVLKRNSQQNSAGNSVSATPSTTPVSSAGVAGSMQLPMPSQSTSPPANNAPKYGTLVPNRVFVGGIASNTTEVELAQLFSAYGTVKQTKIISDRAGISKGYGFVTFESEEEAKRLQREADNIILRERKLNIAPAIKKQPFTRVFDEPSPPPAAASHTQFYYTGTIPYTFQNGVAYYPQNAPNSCMNGDPNAQMQYQTQPVYQPQPSGPQAGHPYPLMYPPQQFILHQQYPFPAIPYDPQQFYQGGSQGGPGYVYGASNGLPGASAQVPSPQGSGPVVPPGSPPRHSYYHQVTYNPEAYYCNIPMYGGGPMESGVGLYSEGIETNGSLNEVLAQFLEVLHNYRELRRSAAARYGDQVSESDLSVVPNNTANAGSASPTSTVSHSSNTATSLPTSYTYLAASTPSTTTTATDRNQTATPVVSLLSITTDERDFQSMQSGRSYRPYTPGGGQARSQNGPTKSQFTNRTNSSRTSDSGDGARSTAYNRREPVTNNSIFNYFHRSNDYTYDYVPFCNRTSTFDGVRRYYNSNTRNDRFDGARRRSNAPSCDSSLLSSPRTQSNSSASVVDENSNEKKDSNTHQFHSPVSRTFDSSFFQVTQQPHHQNSHYVPSARRPRRGNPRRSAQHGLLGGPGPTAEMGAGDGPLEVVSAEMGDMCKKMQDGLKL